MDDTTFNSSLPGNRQLQIWIREQRLLRIELPNAMRHEGVLRFQDPVYLALGHGDATEPVLINRSHILLIRALG